MRNDRPKVIAISVVALLVGSALIVYSIAELVSVDQGGFLWLPLGCFAVFIGVILAAALTKDPFRSNTGDGGARDDSRAHLLEFVVGDRELHRVSYRWDQVWGWLTVTVDGVLTVKEFVFISFRLVSAVEFEVGQSEKHTVRIEKRRPLVASFARPQSLTGFVDGVRVASHDGAATPR